MKIWVTRPKDKADELAQRLKARGHEAIVAPLLTPSYLKPPVPDLTNFHGFIATSARGLEGFDACALPQDMGYDRPLFTVGSATSKAAKQFGWQTIIQGTGRAADLVEEISAHFAARKTVKLLHLSGVKLAFDMALPLAKMGAMYESLVTYDMVRATGLNDDLAGALKAGSLDSVTLLSPATADAYLALTHDRFQEERQKLKHFCLSPAIGEKLAGIDRGKIFIAKTPTMHDFLSLLDP